MSANMKTGKSNTRQGTARQQGRRQDIGHKGAFKIPMAKDWVFRGRESQGELRSHHPEIKRIWVSNRDTQDEKNLIVVEITGATKEVVDACFAEGRQKILDSISYDEKKSKERGAKGKNRPRPRPRRERSFSEEATADPDEILPGDSALVQKMKLAFKDAKNDPKKVAAAKAKKELEATRKKNQQVKAGNAFGALMEDEDDERASLQAQRNHAKQKATLMGPKPVVVQSKPKMTGWAALAAKPKVVVEEKVESSQPLVVFTPPKKVVRDTYMRWGEEEEIEVGGDTWDEW